MTSFRSLALVAAAGLTGCASTAPTPAPESQPAPDQPVYTTPVRPSSGLDAEVPTEAVEELFELSLEFEEHHDEVAAAARSAEESATQAAEERSMPSAAMPTATGGDEPGRDPAMAEPAAPMEESRLVARAAPPAGDGALSVPQQRELYDSMRADVRRGELHDALDRYEAIEHRVVRHKDSEPGVAVHDDLQLLHGYLRAMVHESANLKR